MNLDPVVMAQWAWLYTAHLGTFRGCSSLLLCPCACPSPGAGPCSKIMMEPFGKSPFSWSPRNPAWGKRFAQLLTGDIFCSGLSKASLSQIPHHGSKRADFFDEKGEWYGTNACCHQKFWRNFWEMNDGRLRLHLTL